MSQQPTRMDRTGDSGVPARGTAFWELQGDLATVSCYAATELDNLLLGRPRGLDAVRRLIEIISESIVSVAEPTSPRSLMNPATAVAMNHALLDSDLTRKESLNTVDQLIEASGRVTSMLSQAIENAQEVQEGQRQHLEKLRSLCLALSNRALAFEESVEEPEPDELAWR